MEKIMVPIQALVEIITDTFMTRLYKICSILYRLLFLIVLLFSFVAKVIVGAAGHSSDYSKSDYLAFSFLIITIILLTALHYMDRQTRGRNILRYVVILLVLTSVICEIEIIYSYFIDFKFSATEFIFTAILLLFTVLSLTLFWGLIKAKI